MTFVCCKTGSMKSKQRVGNNFKSEHDLFSVDSLSSMLEIPPYGKERRLQFMWSYMEQRMSTSMAFKDSLVSRDLTTVTLI